MSDYIKPIEKLSDINSDECLSGYRAGHGFIPVDYAQKSASYWHGYQNAMADLRLETPNPVSCVIAREIVAQGRARRMN